MKQIRLIIFLLSSIVFSVYSQSFPDPETRGVWITGNYLQGGTTAVESLVRGLKANNFNAIYICNWYLGSTIYPSTVVPKAGGPAQNPDFNGTDPMRTLIDISHKYGIQVFAWFEYGLSVGVNTNPAIIPNILKVHPDWCLVKKDTTIRYDSDGGNCFFWVDPAVQGAADFIVDLFTECAKNYPDIDGIELDRMRYPSTSFSYSDTARARFMKETNNPDPLTLSTENSAWMAWRRIQVTNLVKRIYQSVKSVNSSCIVTGACVPPYMMYGGDQDKLQGWDVWAKNSYVDMLEPMLYLTTTDFPYQMGRCISYVPAGFNLSAGIAINSSGSVENAISEMFKARTAGATGQVVWYYGYLLSYTNAMSLFKSNIFQTTTAPAYDDLVMDDNSKGLVSTKGTWQSLSGGYKNNYRKAAAVQGDTAIYKVRILRDGTYSIYGYWTGDSASNTGYASIDISTKSIHVVNSVNQKKGIEKWNFVNKLILNSGDTVTIKLSGSDGSDLIADAFRVKRGGSFLLEDKVISDSVSLLLKFSKPLLNPPATTTSITSSVTGSNLNFNIDKTDNTVLHVTIPTVTQGASFNININNLIDIYYDTLTFSTSFTYSPDKSSFLIDDQTPSQFWKLAGNWIKDTNYASEAGSYYYAKQGGTPSRVQWGPLRIVEGGFYEVYIKIPKVNFPLAEKCMYLLKDHYASDTIFVSQAATAGTTIKLGTFPFSVNDVFSIQLSSVLNNDTSKYLASDAVIFKRTVEITSVNKNQLLLTDFSISQNYPNPFNPNTNINIELKNSASVSIDVYNVIGQKIVSLLDGKEFNAGKWNIKFDGSAIPSGVYFAVARIKSNSLNVTKTIKMVLMK